MKRRTGISTLVHVLAILAFMVIGGQFAHAHEVSCHLAFDHASEVEAVAHAHDLSDFDTKGEVHCGAHLLLLAADTKLAAVDAVRLYVALPLHHEWKRGPDFDTPPPRA